MKRACIFDLDGTLTDTVATIAYFANAETAKYGLPAVPVKEFKYLAGDGAQMLIHRMLAYHGIEDKVLENTILSAYSAAYDADFLYLTQPYDGIPELIAALLQRDIQLAVLSNKPHITTEKVVKHFFGTSTFTQVLGQREGFPIKPDPAGVYQILAAMPYQKQEYLYIGDTSTDMYTGKSAGLATVGVLWGFRERKELEESGAQHIIETPADILPLL